MSTREQKIARALQRFFNDLRRIDPNIAVVTAASGTADPGVVIGGHIEEPAIVVSMLAGLFRMIAEHPEIGDTTMRLMVETALGRQEPEDKNEGKANILQKWDKAKAMLLRTMNEVLAIDPDLHASMALDSDVLETSVCVNSTKDVDTVMQMAACIIDQMRVENHLTTEQVDRAIDMLRENLHHNMQVEERLKGWPKS